MFFLNIIQYGNVLKGQGIFNMRENYGVKQDGKRKQGMNDSQKYVCKVCLHNASAKKIQHFSSNC